MKYIYVLMTAVFLSMTADAQISIQLGFNIDRQPIWGPAGYDHVEYYYLPDIEVYYNVPRHRFYYYEQGRWISGTSLPSRYREFDFYHAYKVVINEPSPYRHHKMYLTKYYSYRGRHDQQPIRDSRDERYYINKNHPEHNTWMKQQKNENGHGNGKKKSHDNRRR